MKRLLKRFANAIALLLMAPLALMYSLLSLLGGAQRSLEGCSQTLALLPGLLGVYLRRGFYRWVLPSVGEDVWIGFGVLLTSPKTKLGARVYIGPYCVLGDVVLEDDVLVASHVSIINGGAQHGVELGRPIREQAGSFPQVVIGRGSWLGERSVVMANVGAQTIVGAGAVVTGELPAKCVAVGVPARIVKHREAPATTTKPAGFDESLAELATIPTHA